jgi:hypothetical protein
VGRVSREDEEVDVVVDAELDEIGSDMRAVTVYNE